MAYVLAHAPRTTLGPRGRHALSGIAVRSTLGPRGRRTFGGLGDDTAVELTPAQYQQAQLAELKNIGAWQQRWVEKDEMQRWIQIAATVSIPLSAAIWRLIFGTRV